MNEESNQTESSQEPTGHEYSDRREARRQRMIERRAGRYTNSWVIGAILILVGGLFLLQNFFSFDLDNWWALFILLPAIGAFSNAWGNYQSNQRWTASARSSLIGGIFLVLITAIFLFELSWTFFGPIVLILIGVGLLVNYAFVG